MSHILSRMTAGVLAVSLWTSGALADQTVLKFATTEPPQSVATQVWEKWIAKVNAEADGEFQIEMYSGGALGRDPSNQLELVQSGVADMAWGFPFFTPGKFPDNMVVSMPLVIKDAREGSYAIWSLYERGMLRGWDDVVPVMLCTPTPVIVMSTQPMPDLGSLKGLRSTASTPLQAGLLKTFGASPTSGFNFSNSAEALSRGVLDASLMGYTPAKIFKLYDIAKHAFEMPLGASPCAVFMNKQAYDGLSKKGREILDSNRGALMIEMWADAIDGFEANVRADWLADPDRTLTTLSDAEFAEAEKIVQPLIEEWESNTENGLALVQALREEVMKVRAAK